MAIVNSSQDEKVSKRMKGKIFVICLYRFTYSVYAVLYVLVYGQGFASASRQIKQNYTMRSISTAYH